MSKRQPMNLEQKSTASLSGTWMRGSSWLEGTLRWNDGVDRSVNGSLAVQTVSQLAAEGTVLQNELQLLTRIFQLAVRMVADGHVIAFAAPREVTHEEVYEACQELSSQDEGQIGRWTSKKMFLASWMPAWLNRGYLALRRLYISNAVLYGYASVAKGTENSLGQSPKAVDTVTEFEWREASLWVDSWLWLCADTLVREVVTVPKEIPEESSQQGSSGYRIMYRGEAEALSAWESALATDEREFSGDGWLVWRTLKQALQLASWDRELLHDASGKQFYHLELELLPPKENSPSLDWKLGYQVAHNEWEVRAPLTSWWNSPTRTWKFSQELLMAPDRWILPKLAEAASVVPAIEQSLQSPCPREAVIPGEDVFAFLSQGVSQLEALGIQVKVPSISQVSSSDIRIRVHIKRPVQRAAKGTVQAQGNGWFDTKQLVEFDWKIAIGDTELSLKAFEQMVEERSPLVQLGGSWRLVPLETVLEHMETLRKSAEQGAKGSLIDVARMVMLAEQPEDAEVSVDVDFDDGVRDVQRLVESLLEARKPERVDVPSSFQGTLRDYQKHGFEWLLHLRSIGCGGVLADDMGLGKTIQVLCYWSYLKEQAKSEHPHLLICPTSLLQNWRAELAKFTPDLRVYVHHGGDRASESEVLSGAISHYDIVMTTYATLVRDADRLVGMYWDSVVVDEAQNVKNPDTKQAQVVCGLKANQRIALTGTPIENRLEELWSIFRFAVPGYLGGLTWFRRQFVDAIVGQSSTEASRQLHQVLQPVLLRRSKADPTIQLQLPEKWEVREYAGLTSEQGALYQSIVNRLFVDIEGRGAGMSRRGQILTALVRLKQICDHPCLSIGGSASPERSGKLRLLLDLLEDAVSDGEAALVFTQFRDMGEILCEAIRGRFGWKPKFLHGGLTSSARGDIVDSFQSGKDATPVLVLSLKAGGVGLNLTRANHVFHYDRWWNPAVEDQATDRVFRIGQTRNVQVHKLVCPGTLEERIDELIRSKRSLSHAVVGESEGWLTEMDNESLRSLFELDMSTTMEAGDDW